VLIRSEPRPKSVGRIILPDEEWATEKVEERAGTVVRKGRGRDLSGLPKSHRCADRELQHMLDQVQVGDRVVYRGFLEDANNLKKQWDITDADGNEYCIIDVRDLLAIIGPEVRIGTLKRKGS
jgi:co-chaperonin GroES (HSP10)